MRTYIALLSALGLSACATQPNEIAAAYVSPIQYQNYNCEQIGMELRRVTRRANELHGTLKDTADNDAGQMGVGLILFWPALFFLEGGDGPQAQEYARLRGERDALEQAAIMKNCGPMVEDVPAVAGGASAFAAEPESSPSVPPERNWAAAAPAATKPVLPESHGSEAIYMAYGRCTVDAMIRYDQYELSSWELVERGHNACRSEAQAWRQYYIDQGNDRRRVNQAFDSALQDHIDRMTGLVAQYRAKGLPLGSLQDEL